ncbi:MAG TPA: hypothetical protein VHO68_06880 [Bacteroidales bacterium]|nr:hypothetical protein [Bacteroidales bacterium]
MKKENRLTDFIFNNVQIYGDEYDVFFFGSARATEPGRKRKPRKKEPSVMRLKAKKI